ncbi:MAG TPA: tetratricopeptide repeat protein [Thermoanaerobaculia bacterium]|nr:tetratricopeptide repeat protein [Thermoanaerobaculia bacterium]
MRRWRAVSIALTLLVAGLGWTLSGGAASRAESASARAAAPSRAASLRAEGRQLRVAGRFDEALGRFQEAVFESLATDDSRGAALALSEMGKTHEKAGRSDEALQYYQSALSIDIELRSRADVARDLTDLGRVFLAQGQVERAMKFYGKAQAVVESAIPVEVVVAATPLACGSSNNVTPNPADFTGGTWTGFGSGADEKGALQSVLNQAFGTVYQPTCKTKCPDGSTPARGKCTANVVSTVPTSTTPGDYGSPAWNPQVITLKDGTKRTLIGPVKITKFPADIKAVQSCSACS